MKTINVVLLSFVMAASVHALDLTSLESIAVQDGGRRKPLDTFARESLQKLIGRSSWKSPDGKSMSAMQVFAAMTFGKENWTQVPIIRCDYQPLKKRLGLPVERTFFTYGELADNRELNQIISNMAARRDQSARPEFSKLENAASTLFSKLKALETQIKGADLRLVPPPPQAGDTWLLVSEAGQLYPAKADEIKAAYQAIGQAYQAADSAALAGAAAKFVSLVRELSPQDYPSAAALQRELTYNHVHPFRMAWIAYLLAFLVMLAATTRRGWRGLFYWPAVGLFCVGLAVQIYGFVLRCWIAGRPPVTNMYEVMIWIAFGAALFALIFELVYRPRYFVLAASAVGVLSLILADNLPAVLNPSIQPLVPVLKSNYWLTLHVLTITLGYAAFLLALGIGHIVLGYYVFKPKAQARINELTQFNYRTMQVGLLFLTAGTILGGVWANDSWGRFWGWDPKETWALIAILCYLVVLHGRFTRWMGDFALNVSSVICFQAIIMAAYGVNYVLGTGLHSYGFGVGGETSVAAYVIAELILVGLAMWRYKIQSVKALKEKMPPQTVEA
ncbi:MAG: cytochrome c biogenesis protein CcsA [Candidatus Omnitrophica bacterium]|nr:cytochrome c biogenesis protein CcsA [Candidatus Omnitrophota bacterium]